jgi:hypothetical protein
MKRGWDATRRNRNIGTTKQGLGQDNRLVIPWCGLKLYYQNLNEYKVALRTVHSRLLPFIVERTRADSCHACTTEHLYVCAENGDSLWSAGARDRFGSHLRFLQASGTEDLSGPRLHHCQSIEVDYQSGPERPHSKRLRRFMRWL